MNKESVVMADRDYHGYDGRIFTDEQRLAAMLATGLEPQHGGGDLWEVRHEKGGRWFVSALTGKMNEVERFDKVCNCDGFIWVMLNTMDHPPENFLPEARQRIADYQANDGDVEECLRLIEERKR